MRLTRVRKSSMGGRQERPPVPETVIGIRDEYITLQQLLKMAGVIGTGGEAKYYLAEAAVTVNGDLEQRRGRKLRPGDLIVARGSAPIRLEARSPTEDSEEDPG